MTRIPGALLLSPWRILVSRLVAAAVLLARRGRSFLSNFLSLFISLNYNVNFTFLTLNLNCTMIILQCKFYKA